MIRTTHWTELSVENFAYSVASDFVELLREKMDKLGWNNTHLAKVANVSKGRVTQLFKNPGNLEMVTMAKFARALRMKMAAFPYEDANDPNNERGPINSEIFRICWEKANRPADMWAFEVKRVEQTTVDATFLAKLNWGADIYNRIVTSSARQDQTGDRIIRSFPSEYISAGDIQSVNKALSRHIQGVEVSCNG